MPRNRSQVARDRAREARRDPSAAEAILWSLIRSSTLGFKFRREHPIGPFRLDFYCPEAMLAVEMDGEQHDPERDAVRDAALDKLGILTYRISNRRFFGLEQGRYPDFLQEIQRLCEERSGRPAFPPHPRPLSPGKGEGS